MTQPSPNAVPSAIPSAAPSQGPPREAAEGLRAALAAEHAAIFAYGRLGVLLDQAGRNEARAAETVHRARRDALVLMLDELRAAPVPAEAGYRLPFPVTDRASALKLAAHVEEGVAANWRAVLKLTTGSHRGNALEAYTDAAVRAVRWRKIAGTNPTTSAFPGRVA